MSKYYEIPCSWKVHGTIEVEANSLEEAIALAERDDASIPNRSQGTGNVLFGTSNYVDGSFQVDRDVAEQTNKV